MGSVIDTQFVLNSKPTGCHIWSSKVRSETCYLCAVINSRCRCYF